MPTDRTFSVSDLKRELILLPTPYIQTRIIAAKLPEPFAINSKQTTSHHRAPVDTWNLQNWPSVIRIHITSQIYTKWKIKNSLKHPFQGPSPLPPKNNNSSNTKSIHNGIPFRHQNTNRETPFKTKTQLHSLRKHYDGIPFKAKKHNKN